MSLARITRQLPSTKSKVLVIKKEEKAQESQTAQRPLINKGD